MKTSQETDKIMQALVKVQSQMLVAPFDSQNPHYRNKYASYPSIRTLVDTPLQEAGILLLQPVRTVRGEHKAGADAIPLTEVVVETWLVHAESGQWIMEELALKPMQDDSQQVGSARTYAQRYGLCSLLAIGADEDDDANAASGKTKAKLAEPPAQERFENAAPTKERTSEPAKPRHGSPPKKAQPPTEDNPVASGEEQTEIIALAGKLGITKPQMEAAVKKYAKQTRDNSTSEWKDLHHLTAVALLEVMRAKLKADREKKLEALATTVSSRSITQRQFDQLVKAEFGGKDYREMDPDDIDKLRIRLDEMSDHDPDDADAALFEDAEKGGDE